MTHDTSPRLITISGGNLSLSSIKIIVFPKFWPKKSRQKAGPFVFKSIKLDRA